MIREDFLEAVAPELRQPDASWEGHVERGTGSWETGSMASNSAMRRCLQL